MNKLSFLLSLLAVSTVSAFAPMAQTKTVAFTNSPAAKVSAPASSSVLNMAEDMTWEGEEYPPSKVLGPIMSKMPSGILGLTSIAFFSVFVASLAGSAELQQVDGAMNDGSWVKWYYVLGSFGGPLAWGTHVAAWIQRKNGM